MSIRPSVAWAATLALLIASIGGVLVATRDDAPATAAPPLLPDRVQIQAPPAEPLLPARRPTVPGDSTEVAAVGGDVPGRPSPPPRPEIPVSAAGALRAAGLPAVTTVELADLQRAATVLGLPITDNLDQRAVDRILLEARQRLAVVLQAAGLPFGSVVDDADLARAARALGIDLGFVVDPHDVDRLTTAARARIAPALWVAGGDHGAVVDDGDLRRAASRLGLDVGSVVDPQDVNRIVTRAREVLRRTGLRDVAPGVSLAAWELRLADGPVQLSLLRWRLDDPRVQARTEAATRLGSRASVPDVHADRRPAGAIATVNGGFWLDRGDPDGLLVTDGVLRSDPTTGRSWVRGRRGAFALTGDRWLVGRPSWRGELHADDGTKLEVRGVNRPLRSDEDVVIWTHDAASTTGSPPGTVEVVLDGFVPSMLAGRTVALGTPTTAGDTGIPAGGSVLAARGEAARWLLAHAGTTVVEQANPDAGWESPHQALGAGPVLVQASRLTSRDEWEYEGFGPRHTLARHPRTAIGFTADREALVLVADGRQPGRSIGLSVPETARLLRSFGAVDGLMLDGGGSSHLVVDGHTVNRPCCDPAARPVASTLVVYARPPS